MDGDVYNGETEVKKQIVGFYEKLYKEPKDWTPQVDELQFSQCSRRQKATLKPSPYDTRQ